MALECVKLPIVEGIVPVRSLLLRIRLVSSDSEPIVVGIDPEIEF